MPMYELRCQSCFTTMERYAPMSHPKGSTSCRCGGVARRIYTPPAIPRPFQAHYNWSVGRYVTSERDFATALKQGSEEASAQMGMDVNYTRVDPQELPHSAQGEEKAEARRKGLKWTPPKEPDGRSSPDPAG